VLQQQRINAAHRAAQKCFTDRFNGASHMFVSGSIMRGEGNELSDIDLVVIYPKLIRARRESFIADGFPVEAFVHDPETLAYFVKSDVDRGVPSILHMIADGVIISKAPQEAERLQQQARANFARGPNPLSGESYDALRYALSDLVDDLAATRPLDEMAAVSAMIYPRLIDLILLGRNQWTGKGKWGPRLLRRTDPALADRMTKAFLQAVQGDAAALLALSEQVLAQHGGRYFAGYRVEAPIQARIAAADSSDFVPGDL
jgi:hypothetical protein